MTTVLIKQVAAAATVTAAATAVAAAMSGYPASQVSLDAASYVTSSDEQKIFQRHLVKKKFKKINPAESQSQKELLIYKNHFRLSITAETTFQSNSYKFVRVAN